MKRKKHSHRCPICRQGWYCYKGQCQKPQRVQCDACEWREKRSKETPEERAERERVQRGIYRPPGYSVFNG